ncbi:hypothetical protein KCP70_14675 [Salmonella enterica subsp. enterica]|nr:hypothetical protein KCP70_14675 [Salmonella enterica subsp. enterica]
MQRHGEKERRHHHLTEDIASGRKGADFYLYRCLGLYGRIAKWAERIALLRDYQINSQMMATGNPQVKFLHCLPAFHDDETTLGKKMAENLRFTWRDGSDRRGFESAASIVFDEAENQIRSPSKSGNGNDAV